MTKQSEETAIALISPEFSTNQLNAELLWHELRVCREICPPPPDRISYPSLPEHCITLHVANPDQVKRRLNSGEWKSSPTDAGTLTFVPADHTVEWLWEAEVELLEIYFPPSLLKNVALESFDIASHSIELIDRFAIRDLFLEQIAIAFKAELERGNPVNRLYLESLQNVMAVHLLRHHCCVKVPLAASRGLPNAKLQQIIDYIQDNLDGDIGLAELARVVQVSPHHFGKLFKQSLGVSPHQYVLKSRIERGKKLLADQQRSLCEISQALGFCDQSHFTNVFRRYTSLTPRQYRARL